MLKELIDKFYLDREREKEEKERVRFYVSESGKCARSIFFKFKRAPKAEIGAERLRVFEFGNHIQQIVLRPLISLGLVSCIEVSIPPQEIVSGRADIILNVNGEPYVVDVKSISGKMNFANMKNPMPEHYEQVQLYLHFFKIKKGILLYVNKDTQELKDFVFEYNEELAKNLLKRFEEWKSKIQSDIVPARLEDYPNNWQCKSCEYQEVCSMIGQGELNWQNFKDKIQSQSF